jgi:hypothetical protein
MKRGFYDQIVLSKGIKASKCPLLKECYLKARDIVFAPPHKRLGVRKNAKVKTVYKAYQAKCAEIKEMRKNAGVTEKCKLVQHSHRLLESVHHMTQHLKRQHEHLSVPGYIKHLALLGCDQEYERWASGSRSCGSFPSSALRLAATRAE